MEDAETRLTRCFHCGGTDLEEREIEELISAASYVVRCKVVATVCRQCGERYFDPRTVRGFEKIRGFPTMASFRESLGAETYPGNTIVEMREEERS